MSFWVYMLKCRDGSYYTGHTDNLDARIGQHQSRALTAHTRSRHPVRLVWSETFETRIEALESERRIKGWTRAKKEALIAGDWQTLSLLARNRQDESRPSTSSGRTEEGEFTASTNPVRAEPVEARASESRSA